MVETPQDEPTLADFLAVVRRHLLWILVLTLGLAAVVYFVSRNLPPRYASTARLVIPQAVPFPVLSGLPQPAVSLDGRAFREAALSRTVLKEALSRVLHGELVRGGTKALEAALKRYRFRAGLTEGRTSAVLSLTVESPEENEARFLAQAWAEALVAWDRARVQQSIAQYRASLEAQIQALEAVLKRLGPGEEERRALEAQLGDTLRDLYLVQALEATATSQLAPLEPATLPERVFPRPLLFGLLGGLLGGFLALTGALVREALDQRIRSSEEAHRLTGLPVLAEFPDLPPGSPVETSEAFREAASYLRTSLGSALMNESPKVVAVTSPSPQEGKTSVALALAQAYARSGKKTLLVDLDLRYPLLTQRVARLYRVVLPNKGLEAFLRLPLALPDPLWLEENLALMPSLASLEDPAEALSREFRTLYRLLLEEEAYEVIVLDNPPLIFPDALAAAPHASGVLLVVQEGKTARKALEASLEVLRQVGVRVLGLVLNRVSRSRFGGGPGGYGYPYRYRKEPRGPAPEGSS